MKPHSFIKLFVLLASCFAMSFLIDTGDDTTLSKGSEHVTSELQWLEKRPSSYKVQIDFHDGMHSSEHEHTYNDGTFEIHVTVLGNSHYLETGNLKQLVGNFDCRLSSNGFTGNIKITKTLTIYGIKSEADLRSEFRADIIKTILNKLENT